MIVALVAGSWASAIATFAKQSDEQLYGPRFPDLGAYERSLLELSLAVAGRAPAIKHAGLGV